MRRTDTGGRRLTRGQSDIIGYVILFSAIILAVSTVSLFGVTALEEVKEATVSSNGELAMQSVDANLESLYYGSRTGRTTELSLDSATLATGAPMTVTVDYGTSHSWTLRPIRYESDNAAIVYENSMVVREQDDGAVAVTESLFQVTGDRAIVPVVRTTASPQSVGGGNRRLVARTTGTDRVIHAPGSSFTVTLTVDWDAGERAPVWKRALDERIGSADPTPGDPPCTTNAADDQLTCEFETERVVASVVTVEYELE